MGVCRNVAGGVKGGVQVGWGCGEHGLGVVLCYISREKDVIVIHLRND